MFGISFVDIELLIRLAQNQTPETEPVLPAPDAALLPAAIIPVLPETPSASDSFSTKNSETNIVATLTENIPPVSLAVAENPTKNQTEENNKVADIVFNLTPPNNSSGIKQPVNPTTAANNFSGAQILKQNQMDTEIIFRSLLEKFRTSVVYDYEMSDAVRLEEDAERKQKPLENPSRFANSNAEANRKKEALRKAAVDAENQSAENEIRENKKRELLKKIQEANKFL
ncbi:MAG TPA: hypothetical protein VF721_13665 [Pyrinomonadaceae bacterium]|jgi:hypothetical protein